MQLARWLIVVAVFGATLCRIECKTTSLNVDPAMLQRWNRALQAINDAERQRQEDKVHPSAVPEVGVRQQRPNDRRMRWRSNSKQLRLHRREDFEGRAYPTTFSSQGDNIRNPSYLDVADFANTEAPWWFN
ncbi:uncharacterized protein LOC111069059 [Drosophila obscura]|uniref:uncharacterized protein LOC111069059 n=1 Tax=Drosophila obscura TaxID=7282 RepID=UPI000BA0A0CD|nr:uncharacterized protein LOC111069059 [Drosophila obscura]